MKIREMLNNAIEYVKKENKDIQDVELKCKLILLGYLNISKESYVIIQNEKIDREQSKKYLNLIKNLILNIPIEYILHNTIFMGNIYYINENVLIPRLDTEIVVSESINLIKENNIKSVLDLCAGSGVIGITVADKANISKIDFIDISDKAIDVLNINISNILGKKENLEINVVKSDIFNNYKNKVDLIISNPPYIKTKDILLLDESVKKEPLIALDGGEDGLDLYIKIINEGYTYLNISEFTGYMALEIGYDQNKNIKEIVKNFNNNNNNIKIKIIKEIKDFENRDRCIILQYYQI